MHFFCCVFCLRGIKLGQETIINLNNYIMKKKEKLEQFYLQAQKLGLSPQEVDEYFYQKMLKLRLSSRNTKHRQRFFPVCMFMLMA